MPKLTWKHILPYSVSGPFHFATAPESRIRFVEKRIRIRPKIEKKYNLNLKFFFLLLITPKNIVILFYEPIIYNALIYLL